MWVTKKDKTCKLVCGMVKKKKALLRWFLLNKLHFIISMPHWVKKHLRSSAFTQRNLNPSTYLSFYVTKVFISCSFLLACEKKMRFFFSFWRRSFQIKLYQIIQLVSTAMWNSVLLENNDGICNIFSVTACLCDAFYAGSLMTLLLQHTLALSATLLTILTDSQKHQIIVNATSPQYVLGRNKHIV